MLTANPLSYDKKTGSAHMKHEKNMELRLALSEWKNSGGFVTFLDSFVFVHAGWLRNPFSYLMRVLYLMCRIVSQFLLFLPDFILSYRKPFS
jgi:hypothetical protein